MAYEDELNVALQAVRKASNLCRKVQKTLVTAETIQKKDKSPVTVADLGSQSVISLDLLSAFPNDAIVGEEEADVLREKPDVCSRVLELVQQQAPGTQQSAMIDSIDFGKKSADYRKRYWTVDPIDGTKGFLRGEQYAIALALVESGEVVLGVLGCPNFKYGDRSGAEEGSLFFAVKGQGAFVNYGSAGPAVKISVSPDPDPANARFCESVERAHASHEEHARISTLAGIKAPPYRIDSQAKYAAVACGNASIYLRLPRTREYREKIWDHAAGCIVVREAGGRVSDFSGNELDFSIGHKLLNNEGILATNGLLHEKVLDAIRQVVQL